MNVVIHKETDSLKKIIPKWMSLKDKLHEMTVFQDIHWVEMWWDYKNNKSSLSPYIVEIRKGKETIGIIPLYISEVSFRDVVFRILKPMGTENFDYLIPVFSKHYPPKEQFRKALNKIYADQSNWDFIDWRDIPEYSIFDNLLKGKALKKRALIERNESVLCPYLILDSDIDEIKNKFHPKLVKEITKKIKRLKRKGDLYFNVVKEEQELDVIMNCFFKFHCERYKNTDTPSNFSFETEREYFRQVAKNLLKNNLLHLTYLSLNNEILAVEFSLVDDKSLCLYQTAFNEKYKKHSPGNVLLFKMILNACQQGYEIVDFARGAESYKQQWGTIDRYNADYAFYNKTISSYFYKLIRNTYYCEHFKQKSVFKQLSAKIVIRSCVYMLGVYRKFNDRKMVEA